MNTLHRKTRAELETLTRPGLVDSTETHDKVRVLNTFDLWVDKYDRSVTPSLRGHGYWETWITQWFCFNVNPGDVVWDVGANCGYYSLLSAHLVGKEGFVVAYEPNPVQAEWLSRSVNESKHMVGIRRRAVSDTYGDTVLLTVPGDYHGSASIMSDFPEYDTQIFDVQTTTLDHDAASMRKPNIIKMDIEGAEELAWNGARDMLYGSTPPVVALEYTPGAYSDTFTNELYRYWNVYRIGFDGYEYPITKDILRQEQDWVMITLRRKV